MPSGCTRKTFMPRICTARCKKAHWAATGLMNTIASLLSGNERINRIPSCLFSYTVNKAHFTEMRQTMKHFSKFFSGTHFPKTEADPTPDYNIDKELANISTFIRSGLVVLSVILLSGIAIGYGQKNAIQPHTSTSGSRISNKKLPIYCVEQNEKKVALSFDAAWGNEDTKKILDILKKKKVHVTFFMTGGWIEKYPDDVKAICKAGHELGNHSQNHKQMSTLSAEECKEEIMAPHEKVKELTGVEMQVFRPPYTKRL